ncbi:MAG: helix-turn-helix transcriptional regulator [Bdellovibrionales bacterium]|nr:helix-turn-helix transcriptional regulator [Bdellovibrionales bacterium]
MSTAKNKEALPFLEKLVGPVTFAMFVRVCRTSLEISQTDMAKKLGIARGTLCDIEKGRQGVSVAFAVKIARRAGLSEEMAVEYCIKDQLARAKIPMEVTVKKIA